MSAILKLPPELKNVEQQYGLFSDFVEDQLDALFVDTVTDSGTVLMGDAANGIAVLTPSDGTVADNDEAYFASPNEVFLFAAEKPALAIARLQFTEANVDDANVFFGFMNAIAANSLVDNGGGPQASGSQAVIYKIDGGTVWRCSTRNNGVVTDSVSNATAGGASYQKLEVEVVPFTSTKVKVLFRVDGVPLKDSTTGREIVHTVTVASATEMQVGVGLKNGAGNLETLNVDYLGAWQARA
jgi:hypothetical protein